MAAEERLKMVAAARTRASKFYK
ncbi:uncharacterized protein G2W53_015328 [Senna tora]|uniref:Uncharacterized protein n=1 Tax=Senna tora TaxID=362788 RepID=A0A835C7E2_9FABA|nr:uncharacterized protein G2W53_015328 [Senna tora]